MVGGKGKERVASVLMDSVMVLLAVVPSISRRASCIGPAFLMMRGRRLAAASAGCVLREGSRAASSAAPRSPTAAFSISQ